MREGVLLQALHFNSLLIDPFNDSGAKELNVEQTNWNNNELRGRKYIQCLALKKNLVRAELDGDLKIIVGELAWRCP